MFDLYALPNNFPSKEDPTYQTLRTGHQKACYLEQALAADIGERNFIPNLMVHEFEALVLVDPEQFSDWTEDQHVIQTLRAVRQVFTNPEDINDSPQTAPSKRILAVMPDYNKVVQGVLIAEAIGLDRLRNSCPHFSSWLQRLEQLTISS